eukprot:CAMPEP_0119304586 /NCGR_PEP_ID=MMETSP1333-20130426/5772_1 /TAXON_ID=418940 /ORGANISM="Scyphosphaera apsteinii, Strain RCC1455" /LENGTH=74 /DNA_ID=CAMNT_0007307497 /DNA_START=196 /DNA_END=420 /DNA_ORIENTATION=-
MECNTIITDTSADWTEYLRLTKPGPREFCAHRMLCSIYTQLLMAKIFAAGHKSMDHSSTQQRALAHCANFMVCA